MRRKRGIPFELFQAFTFGSDEELVITFGSLEAAEKAWNDVSEEFFAHWDLWGMPEAWWRFEPGVPNELRRGPSLILTEADARTWERLEGARREYLSSLGIDPTSPSRRFRSD